MRVQLHEEKVLLHGSCICSQSSDLCLTQGGYPCCDHAAELKTAVVTAAMTPRVLLMLCCHLQVLVVYTLCIITSGPELVDMDTKLSYFSGLPVCVLDVMLMKVLGITRISSVCFSCATLIWQIQSRAAFSVNGHKNGLGSLRVRQRGRM